MAVLLVGERAPALIHVVARRFVSVVDSPACSPDEEAPSDPATALADATVLCPQRGAISGSECVDCPRLVDVAAGGGGKLSLRCRFSSDDRVDDWMVQAHHLVTTTPEARCDEAEALADERGAHHLLVLDGKRTLVGEVCRHDLADGGAAAVGSRMQRDVYALASGQSMGVADAAMRWLDVGALVVVSGVLVLGMLTRADLRRAGVEIADKTP